MNCLKCGHETDNDSVFCVSCLLEMEKYPVDSGTVVLLPRRKDTSLQKKAVKRHISSPEEQVAVLRKWVLILTLLLAVCTVAIVLMFEPAMHYIQDEHFEVGQNYSTVTVVTVSPVSTTPETTE